MAELKPVYLVYGEDDPKIDAWRVRVRRRAEAEQGPGALEAFDANSAEASAVAASLSALTFATGVRYLLVDSVQAWKAPDLAPLTDALADMPPDTVLVLVVRGKPLKALVKAVEGAGGETRSYDAPKVWELPRWAAAQAGELGLRMSGDAAKLLVSMAGPSQQRLTREIEKLAIALHPETAIRVEDVERLASGDANPRVYDLADAVAGRNLEAAIEIAEDLAAHDERPSRFVYPIVSRLREVHLAVRLLEAGKGDKDLAARLKLPPWRVKKIVPLARRADREVLERALARLAELEVQLRGGSALDEETAVTLALADAAA